MIIYPPHIGDTIPGFVNVEGEYVKIPFTHNVAAVDQNEVARMKCIIKDLNSSSIIQTLTTGKSNIDIVNGMVRFKIGSGNDLSNILPGSYYKFQIAYVWSEEVDGDTKFFTGPYSSTSIGRCVGSSLPTLNLEIEEDGITFKGTYSYDIVTEPIYDYRFDFINLNTQETIHTTGWIVYTHNNNTSKSITIRETLYEELKYDTNYQAVFSIRTVNNYNQTVTKNFVKQGELPIVAPNLNIKAEQDVEGYNNGYVKISLYGTPVVGDFELLRRVEGATSWDKLADINLLGTNSDLQKFIWKDRSVEHGVSYTYAIRRRGNIVSQKLQTLPITVGFEDMFLSDNARQLKIRFNPKVSSFKDTILESKIDTIGNQYPFFFRNSQVRYKEIPISGLISYLMDEADLFNNNKISNKTINLTEDNIAAERKFKLEVLEWLTDGQPKLFRSPTEGNYVVRLMNTSLSPNDTVGRMLHQFSSTGYECGPHDYQGLKDQGVMPSNAVIADPRPQPTITTKNLNTTGLITGEFWNIVYTTTTPSLQTLIKVDGKDIVNNTTSGTIVIPSAKKIAWEAQNSTITYNYQPELSKPEDEKDEFLESVNNTEDVMFTLPNDKTSYDLSNFILIYSLTITPKVNWTTVNGKLEAENKNNLKVIIDGQPIDLSDGNSRCYNECTVQNNIEYNSDISVTIYGRRIKN